MLTNRETEILKLICEDLSHKLIADRLNISKRTVDVHKYNMIKKLGVFSVIGLVRYAYDIELVEPKYTEYLDINKTEPVKDCRCEVLTNLGRTFEVDYYDEQGIFYDDSDKEIGWKDNGEKPELVIKWKEIS